MQQTAYIQIPYPALKKVNRKVQEEPQGQWRSIDFEIGAANSSISWMIGTTLVWHAVPCRIIGAAKTKREITKYIN